MTLIELYTDGGGTKDSTAGAGAIVRLDGEETRLVGYLGGATNNEAEIFAGLLGFSFIYCLRRKRADKFNVHWVSDSEYLLKSATSYIHGWQRNGWKTSQRKPVKNRGMWQAYLTLAEGLTITPEHVFGHSGHPENEACDKASTWAREYGREASDNDVCCTLIEVDASSWGQNWLLIDGSRILDRLREDSGEEGDGLLLASLLETQGPCPDSISQKAPQRPSEIERAISSLEGFITKLEKSPTADENTANLAQDLKDLLKKYC